MEKKEHINYSCETLENLEFFHFIFSPISLWRHFAPCCGFQQPQVHKTCFYIPQMVNGEQIYNKANA
jgi:hypothetical protein